MELNLGGKVVTVTGAMVNIGRALAPDCRQVSAG